MSETISGGFYIGSDGEPHDAHGKPIKLTAALRKELAAKGIKLPAAKKKPKPAPSEEESAPLPEPEG